MKIFWSPHARILQNEILAQIRETLSSEDALKWYDRMCEAVAPLAEFPFLGTEVPAECFYTAPENINQLHQTFCGPYRIVYEVVADEIHILSIRHTRMIIKTNDTAWS